MAKKVLIHSEPSLKEALKRSRQPSIIIREELIFPDRLVQYAHGKNVLLEHMDVRLMLLIRKIY